jgi:hypothetical protein
MPIETPSKELLVTTFVESISNRLIDSLTPEEKQLLPEVLPLLRRFYLELEVNHTFLDPKNPDALTRGSVALALAFEWYRHTPHYSELKNISDNLLLLFLDKDRSYAEENTPHSDGELKDSTVIAVLKAAFPSFDADWGTSSLTEILERIIESKGSGSEKVLRLPFSMQSPTGNSLESEASQFLTSVYEANPHISEGQHKYFLGFYHPESKIVVLWQDSSPQTEIHEGFHAQNSGLLAGGLGHILNEGMTDSLTHQTLRDRGASEQDIALIRSKSRYMKTVQTVEAFKTANPELGDRLLQLYREKNTDDAVFVSTTLMQMLGTTLYAQLYTGLPGGTQEADIFDLTDSIHQSKTVIESQKTPGMVIEY